MIVMNDKVSKQYTPRIFSLFSLIFRYNSSTQCSNQQESFNPNEIRIIIATERDERLLGISY